MSKKINLDALGVTTSILCAIHCAILPLVMASLPILGVNILHNALFEYGMIGLAFAIGTTALWHGFNRHHHRLSPWLLFTGGMLFLIAKEIWPRYELALLPFAVLLIVGAHWLNYRWCRIHGHQAPHSRHPGANIHPGAHSQMPGASDLRAVDPAPGARHAIQPPPGR